ncbi:MAG: hypothetical protein LBT00_03835 [Spirochaetaceae bacterium]|nr:hypothetical protein [Spirochaetaceae bacterium]
MDNGKLRQSRHCEGAANGRQLAVARSNPDEGRSPLDCFASLAMTGGSQ